jgi:hypothetical protein
MILFNFSSASAFISIVISGGNPYPLMILLHHLNIEENLFHDTLAPKVNFLTVPAPLFRSSILPAGIPSPPCTSSYFIFSSSVYFLSLATSPRNKKNPSFGKHPPCNKNPDPFSPQSTCFLCPFLQPQIEHLHSQNAQILSLPACFAL